MALNEDRIGHVYPSWTYEVSRAKIHEYASALGETDPRHTSDGDDCVAPPTFAANFTIMQGAEAMVADPELGAHWKLVHAGQSYEFGERPIRPGDVISCTPRIADIRHRGENEMLTIEIDCRFDDSDELAVMSTGLIVFLGSAPGRDDDGDADDGGVDAGAAA